MTLDMLFIKANRDLEPPCKDYRELENHPIDAVVGEIRRNEI